MPNLLFILGVGNRSCASTSCRSRRQKVLPSHAELRSQAKCGNTLARAHKAAPYEDECGRAWGWAKNGASVKQTLFSQEMLKNSSARDVSGFCRLLARLASTNCCTQLLQSHAPHLLLLHRAPLRAKPGLRANTAPWSESQLACGERVQFTYCTVQ